MQSCIGSRPLPYLHENHKFQEHGSMLNFRKLRQDFSPNILKEGKTLRDKEAVQSAKIIKLSSEAIRILSKVVGQFDHTYTCEVEIDRAESCFLDSDCDCLSKYDCQHQAALIHYLEEHLDEMIVDFSKGHDFNKTTEEDEKIKLQKTVKEAENQADKRKGKKLQKELIEEYVKASSILGKNPFFVPEEERVSDKAEVALVFNDQKQIEVQIALRLRFRSKPLYVLNIKEFFESIRYAEPLYLGNKSYFFTQESFDKDMWVLLRKLIACVKFPEFKGERNFRIGCLEPEDFGDLLAESYQMAIRDAPYSNRADSEDPFEHLPGLYFGDIETPLCYSWFPVRLRFELEYLISSAPKIMLKSSVVLNEGVTVHPEDVHLFESESPGMIHNHVYYRFDQHVKRRHLHHLYSFQDLIIPEPLFGTFVENAFHELQRFAEVSNKDVIERFVTLPFVNQVDAECDISFLEGEFEAQIHFLYNGNRVSLAALSIDPKQILSFVTPQGILARNLTEEQRMIDGLFQDFIFEPGRGVFKAKSDRKIVEFMTEVIPRFQPRITFHCPENLLDRFIYDETAFVLHLKESPSIDSYIIELKVNGQLKGLTLNQLWECLSSRRPYVEIVQKKQGKKTDSRNNKILVLNLDRLAPIVQIFDELGIQHLNDSKEEHPLWSLVSIEPSMFDGMPIKFSMSKRLMEIQEQMLGKNCLESSSIPEEIRATLRPYQIEGVQWLERLRKMHLNGILADDMGLGKTLQTIITLTQAKKDGAKAPSLVVCPTSLVYNWKEELNKFNPELSVLAVDGIPNHRKKAISENGDYDVLVTSYSLMQKDIDLYKEIHFHYAILDEAQAIKNRGTRNAKSVKQLKSKHRLILSGTPVENSLEELWSLFDYLMPGLLSTYDRFVDKYVRNSTTGKSGVENLKKKVSPFILRRMKEDVIQDLPPISDIVYHCHLSDAQKALYRSYAASAREELCKLVKKEGFEKVQIHVLATLTRLKQICCHPALIAKEKAEVGDSAKYDMLLELLQTLIEGKHRTVIFSQYTKMLHILKEDLQRMGVPFEYLDGTSKNRLNIVKRFNEDASIPVFLVSLKAGGSGLNLVGADTVIHYDMWWNPAVENQATDRVHRIGQLNSVSSYKLITLDSIEEYIVKLQDRKRGLEQLVTSDEEVISKLTWEEVLQLLQT